MFLNNPVTSDLFKDWERYPAALRAIFTQDDVDFYHRRLQNDARRLFNAHSTNICLETLLHDPQPAPAPTLISDSVSSEKHLEEALIKHFQMRGDHYISLRQPHSWAPFSNSESSLRKIFTAVKVRPSFLDFVHAFGQPLEGYEADFSGGYDCWYEMHTDKETISDVANLEFFYNMRYVVKTGREGWPWSERKLGIYHRYEHETASSTWILLQPIASARKLAETFSPISTHTFIMPHIFLFQRTLPSWKAYLKYLEAHVRKESRYARLDTSMELHKATGGFQLAFSNIQTLQHRCELIHDAISALRSNLEILGGLKSLNERIIRSPLGQMHASDPILDQRLETCISRLAMNQRWAEDMLDRAKQASRLMTSLLDAKHGQALASNTASMNQLAEASKQDGRTMLELAKAAKKDSATMKLIAVATIIYLPGTFVATVFSTGFLTTALTGKNPGEGLPLATQAMLYALVTVGLTILTLIAFYSRNRKVIVNEGM